MTISQMQSRLIGKLQTVLGITALKKQVLSQKKEIHRLNEVTQRMLEELFALHSDIDGIYNIPEIIETQEVERLIRIKAQEIAREESVFHNEGLREKFLSQVEQYIKSHRHN